MDMKKMAEIITSSNNANINAVFMDIHDNKEVYINAEGKTVKIIEHGND